MAQPTKPGNAERGWNDPPMFLHTPPSGAAPQSSPRKTLLNKRVPFPGVAQPNPSSDSNVDTASSTPPMMIPGAPPVGSSQPPVPDAQSGGGVILFPPASTTDVPRFPAPIIVPAMSPPENEGSPIVGVPTATNPVTNLQVTTQTSDELTIPDFDDDQQLFNFVITRLQRVLKDSEGVLNKRVSMEVQKKLDILSTMWESGHISYQVKSIMAKLATALHRRKCDAAHQLHLSLMMDYVSEVGPWMVGIKRLIQEARNIDAPLSPTDTTATLTTDTSSVGTSSEETKDSPNDSHDLKANVTANEPTDTNDNCAKETIEPPNLESSGNSDEQMVDSESVQNVTSDNTGVDEAN